MSGNKEIAQQVMDACMNKDFAAVRRLVDAKYTLKDPMMQLNGPEELIKLMENCPGDSKPHDLILIAEGDKVVATFTTTMPGNPPLRMCSVMTIKDGKLFAEEMFYDSAKIPQEMKDAVQKAA